MSELESNKVSDGDVWSAGDYQALGGRLTPVSERLCDAIDLRSTWAVLDAATGTGNTALAVARHGCRVVAIDTASGLLQRAHERARAERLGVEFRLADVESMPFEDNSFDAVVSTFGLPFAANTQAAVAEVARVCRAGGRLALTSWSARGANAEEDAVFAAYLGDDDPPSQWGTAEGISAALAGSFETLAIEERQVIVRFPSIEAYADTLLSSFGPLATACAELTEEQQRGLRQDLIDRLSVVNESGDHTMVIPFPYLEVVAVVLGAD